MGIKAQTVTPEYALYCGDSMEVLPKLIDSSVKLSIYSPPFAGLYQYSSDPRDLSNCLDYGEFFDHYEFTVQQIHRLTAPGRFSAVHCMDIPSGNTGLDHLRDFPGDIIRLHCQCRNTKCKASERERGIGMCGHGWFRYVARYHVWKEPLTVRNRTMTKSLHHSTLVTDSTRCSIANADYLLIFRREGKNAIPVSHPTGLMDYAGERRMPADVLKDRGRNGDQKLNTYSQWIWRQYASAFWDDVRLDRVLPHREAKEEEDEKHVHPLQLDVIERAVIMWSNPGEVVLSPFMGVGSEVYGAVLNGRKAIGIDLKLAYYNQALKNVATALETRKAEIQQEMFAQVVVP